MNKKTKTVALFSVLSLMAVSCQKENFSDCATGTSISEMDTVYTVQYTIDGTLYQTTIHSESERAELIHQLFAIVKKGHEVVLYNKDKPRQSSATKETIYFSTMDETEALAWTQKMTMNEYNIRMYYDSEKKVYNCIAWK